MKTKIFILFLLAFAMVSHTHAQEKMSNGDKYFYSYAYKEAVAAYQKDMANGEMVTNHQLLNLADSYFRTGDYNNASKIYLDINKKEDSIISANRFNMMLQSLSKTSESERVKAFMNSKKDMLSTELVENAQFNFQLLETNASDPADLEVFNANGNSSQNDFSPTFYKDKLLFSSSRPDKSKKIYEPSGESYLDIYVARIGDNGRILNPNKFTGMPDSKYHKSTPQYSEEMGRLFYILSNAEGDNLAFDDNGKNALAIGMAYDGGFFRFLLRDLSTSFYYPYFDYDSGKLYFAANFDDGYGGTDIYYVYTNNGQIMSEPINLGPRINSPGNEISPFIYEGSLYFSSDIFYGLGGMDVYKSNMEADETFSIPVNIGKGINSKADDFGLILRADEKKGLLGYFASNRPGGLGSDDIYGFTMKQAPGLKTFILKGKVVNLSSNRGVPEAQVRLVGKDGTVIEELLTNKNGDFRLEVPWQDELTIQGTKEGYSVFTATYVDAALEEIQKSSFNMGVAALENLVEEKEGKTVLDINKFFFARNRSDLTPAITAELDKVLDAISRFPKLQIRIETNTDSRGSSSSNKRISQKRADAIKGYLLANGASSSNIVEAIGYGEDRIMNNCTNGVYCLDFLHEQNRRTLFVVTNYEDLK